MRPEMNPLGYGHCRFSEPPAEYSLVIIIWVLLHDLAGFNLLDRCSLDLRLVGPETFCCFRFELTRINIAISNKRNEFCADMLPAVWRWILMPAEHLV
jgi:hypothetical protein